MDRKIIIALLFCSLISRSSWAMEGSSSAGYNSTTSLHSYYQSGTASNLLGKATGIDNSPSQNIFASYNPGNISPHIETNYGKCSIYIPTQENCNPDVLLNPAYQGLDTPNKIASAAIWEVIKFLGSKFRDTCLWTTRRNAREITADLTRKLNGLGDEYQRKFSTLLKDLESNIDQDLKELLKKLKKMEDVAHETQKNILEKERDVTEDQRKNFKRINKRIDHLVRNIQSCQKELTAKIEEDYKRLEDQVDKNNNDLDLLNATKKSMFDNLEITIEKAVQIVSGKHYATIERWEKWQKQHKLIIAAQTAAIKRATQQIEQESYKLTKAQQELTATDKNTAIVSSNLLEMREINKQTQSNLAKTQDDQTRMDEAISALERRLKLTEAFLIPEGGSDQNSNSTFDLGRAVVWANNPVLHAMLLSMKKLSDQKECQTNTAPTNNTLETIS